MNVKLYKLIALGYLCIGVPVLIFFVFFCKLTFFNGVIGVSGLFFNLVVLILTSWANWSLVSPFYKKYCVKRLETRKEYEDWYFLAVINLLILQDDSPLNITELWSLDGKREYNERIEQLKNS